MTSTLPDHVHAPGGGRIGLVRCPGTRPPSLSPFPRGPDPVTALQTLRAWPTTALVSLVEAWELSLLGVEDLGDQAREAGFDWLHLPIIDMSAPDRRFTDAWPTVGPRLHARLDAGEHIVVHCRAGLGRTGTVAALLLIERGMPVDAAIQRVRGARPGAIEATEQEEWLYSVAAARTR